MRLHVLALTLALSLPVGAYAQTQAAPGNQQDMLKMMHLAAHNQLGVLEYCQTSGFIGPDVVPLQKRMLAMLPPTQVDGLDAAEASGKQGVVVFAGNRIPMAEAAAAQSTTPEAMCKQMGSMLQTQAANLPK